MVKSLFEKFRKKGRNVYMAFMDLKNTYDIIDREALRNVVCKYGVRGKLLNAMKELCNGCRTCGKVKRCIIKKIWSGCWVETGVYDVPVAIQTFHG